MKEIIRAASRGKSDLGWLQSRFSFSFADYYDEKRMGFGKLRVLNDDVIAPGKGFGEHPHENMEIITFVMEGALEHKDNTGSTAVLKPGDVQVMSAGSGIVHSEYNHSSTEKVELFQIWVETKQENIQPRHDERSFDVKDNSLTLIVSGNKEENALTIYQDAKFYLGKNIDTKFDIRESFGVYLMVIEGSLDVDGEKLARRDAIQISGTAKIHITASDAYFLLMEVPSG